MYLIVRDCSCLRKWTKIMNSHRRFKKLARFFFSSMLTWRAFFGDGKFVSIVFNILKNFFSLPTYLFFLFILQYSFSVWFLLFIFFYLDFLLVYEWASLYLFLYYLWHIQMPQLYNWFLAVVKSIASV